MAKDVEFGIKTMDLVFKFQKDLKNYPEDNSIKIAALSILIQRLNREIFEGYRSVDL